MRCIKRFGSRGFTLTELLVAIGIITILLAILLPALGRAREHGHQIMCLNNEKQIAAAIFLYVNDNHGTLPLLIQPFPPNQTPFEAICMVYDSTLVYDKGVLWPYIAPDIATRQRIFNCPSDPDPKYVDARLSLGGLTPLRNFSYGLTYELNKCCQNAPLLHGSNSHGLDGIYAMPITMVRHPEQKLLVLENYAPGEICGDQNYIFIHAGGSLSDLTSRHSGTANVAFFDGHCEPFDPATFSGLISGPEVTRVYDYWVNVLR